MTMGSRNHICSFKFQISNFKFVICLILLAFDAPAHLFAQEKSSPAEVTRQIDAYFDRYWAEHGLQPSPAADDAAFLRRAMLDLTGIIPEIGEVRAFLADDRPEKRLELIDNLLQRPRHAAHLAHVWRQVLLPRTVPDATAAGLENWLQGRFAENGAVRQPGARYPAGPRHADAVAPRVVLLGPRHETLRAGRELVTGVPGRADPLCRMPRPSLHRLAAGRFLGVRCVLRPRAWTVASGRTGHAGRRADGRCAPSQVEKDRATGAARRHDAGRRHR